VDGGCKKRSSCRKLYGKHPFGRQKQKREDKITLVQITELVRLRCNNYGILTNSFPSANDGRIFVLYLLIK
jgi:hypothetical protein